MRNHSVSALSTVLLVVFSAAQAMAGQFGGFNAIVDYAVNDLPKLVRVADFNKDGKLDILSINVFTLGVLIGNGDGTFQPAMSTSVGQGYLNDAAVADMNEDGFPDVVVSAGGGIFVLLGNGDGTFQQSECYATMPPNSLVAADLNGDGHVDIAALQSGNGLPSSLVIFLGAGDGSLRADNFSKFAYQPNVVVTGDFNADGKPDLALLSARSFGTLNILLGNGDGTFQRAGLYPAHAPYAYAMAVADTNLDNAQDIVFLISFSSSAHVQLGNGDGTFKRKLIASPANSYVGGLVAADFDNDGVPDLALGALDRAGFPAVQVLLGNGRGEFNGVARYRVGSYYDFTGGIAVGDFNGDGWNDIVVAVELSNCVGVLINAGGGL